MEPREPLQRSDRRESYVQDLRALARTAPSPEYEAPKRLGNNNNNIMSPKSFFEDDSSDEEEGLGRRLKRSFSSMKVSTRNFLAHPSQAHGGGSGGGGTADGSSIGLGIGEMEQERQSPVISSPTNFRRLNSAHGKSSMIHLDQAWLELTQRCCRYGTVFAGKQRQPPARQVAQHEQSRRSLQGQSGRSKLL